MEIETGSFGMAGHILTSMHCIVYSKELYCLDHLSKMMRPSMIQVMKLEILVRESRAAVAVVTEVAQILVQLLCSDKD